MNTIAYILSASLIFGFVIDVLPARAQPSGLSVTTCSGIYAALMMTKPQRIMPLYSGLSSSSKIREASPSRSSNCPALMDQKKAAKPQAPRISAIGKSHKIDFMTAPFLKRLA